MSSLRFCLGAFICASFAWLLEAKAGGNVGVSPQSISLPSGPGSIEGLGESFEPQLNTGTANHSIQFALPPGRVGHQPKLGIRYNGGSGNGVLGMGWSLSGLPYVQRQSDKGLPTYDDAAPVSQRDTFVTSDGEELVPLSDGSFRVENEGAFRRYVFDRVTNEWTCQHPDGTTVVLGSLPDARVADAAPCDQAGSSGTCRNTGRSCAADVDCTRTFRWYVSRIDDRNGNRIEFGYTHLAACDAASRELAGSVCNHNRDCGFGECIGSRGNPLPSRVWYTRHATETSVAGHEHIVAYSYETILRPDAFSDFRSGFEVATAHRLARVDVCTAGGTFTAASSCDGVGVAGAARVRAYVFEYDEGGACGESPGEPIRRCARGLAGAPCSVDNDCVAGASRLARVRRIGADGVAELPPATFEYTNLDAGRIDGDNSPRWRTLVAPGLSPSAIGNEHSAFVDLDSDGLADFLDTSGVNHRVWQNCGPTDTGTIRFGRLEGGTCAAGTQEFPGNGRRLGSPGALLADMNSDGITDLVHRQSANEFRLYLGTGRGHFSPVWSLFPFSGYDGFGLDGFRRADVQLVDLDFDKRIDVVQASASAGSYEILTWGNSGGGLLRTGSCGDLLDVDFAGGGAALADLNGDRLLDIVVVQRTSNGIHSIKYYPATGRGGFGTDSYCEGRVGGSAQQGGAVFLCGGPGGEDCDETSTPGEIEWQDIDGNGLADLIHTGLQRVDVWVNMGGNRLHRLLFAGYPDGVRYSSGIDSIRFLDVNGNGTTDLVLADVETGQIRYLDTAGPEGAPPHLLRKISNGIGLDVHIDYGSSTDELFRDQRAGRPWRTRAPFPVSVVTSRTVSTGLDLDGDGAPDRYVTDYRYHDGYYDGHEKEFRGFGEVEVIEHGDDGQPPLRTRHGFHTGAPDGRDNDADGAIDQFTPAGGAEEEPLKGMPLEARHETCGDAPDPNAVNACKQRGTTFDHVLNQWDIRRLYAPSVCSGDRSAGCCSDGDCTPDGLGSCIAENPAAPGALPLRSCIAGKPVRFPVRTLQRTAVLEGGTASARKDLMTATDFDAYGNKIAETNWGVVGAPDLPPFGCVLPQGTCSQEPRTPCGTDADCLFGTCDRVSLADGGAPCVGDPFVFTNEPQSNDERFNTARFAVNEPDWLLRFECEADVAGCEGCRGRRSRSFYDGSTGECAAPTRGNLTRRDEWLEPGGRWITRLRNTFDPFGNITEVIDARGSRRTLDYDASFQTFPVSERIHLDGYDLTGLGHAGTGCERSAAAYSLEMTAAYHAGFGVMTDATTWGRNGQPGPNVSFEHDTFGRLLGIVQPGDSAQLPTTRYDYHLADPAAPPGDLRRHLNAIVSRRREVTGAAGTIDAYQYVDGLGRKLGTKEEGDRGEWIFTGAKSFNQRGQESASILPFCTATPDYESPLNTGGASSSCSGDNSDRHRIRMEYDAAGKPVRTINPDGTHGRVDYRPLATDTYDENDTGGQTPGAHVTHENDGLGRLVGVIERNLRRCDARGDTSSCGEYRTRYAYDERDNLTKITDAQENEKYIEYDSLDRKVFMDDPNRGHYRWTYDDTHNVTETTDARSQVNRYTYDRANRVLTEDYLDRGAGPDPVDVTYVYDLPATDIDMGDGTRASGKLTAGYLASVCDLSGEEHTSYDERRRVEWELKRVRHPLHPGVLTPYATRMAYDALDRLTALTYPDGDRLTYAYGSRGLIDQIAGAGGGRTILSHAVYRPSGQLASVEYGNGVVTERAYDARLRLSALHTRGAGVSAGRDLIRYQYEFDPVSNITAIIDARTGIGDGDPRRNTQAFGYDDLHRLTKYELAGPARSNDAGRHITYRYDKLGNMLLAESDIAHLEKGLSVTHLGTMSYGGAAGASGRQGRAKGDPEGPHALTATASGRAYKYDDNGNMNLIDGMTARWDHKNRLRGLDSSEIGAEYHYDYTDRRITKKVVPKDGAPVTATSYVNRYFEVRDNGQPVKYAWMVDTRVAQISGTLDAGAPRVQRIDLSAGWNLVTLAVGPSTDPLRLAESHSVVDEAYRWRPGEGYEALTGATSLQSGDILWLHASAADTLAVRGAYVPVSETHIAAGGTYVGLPWLEQVRQETLPSKAIAWFYGSHSRSGEAGWRVRPPVELAEVPNELVGPLSPGSVLYIVTSAASYLSAPTSSSQVAYYHHDHLGSSHSISDDAGGVSEEIAYYSFGQARYVLDIPSAELARYRFAQKEWDSESSLQYFEARYLNGPLGRFVTSDPLVSRLSAMHLEIPQKLNPYAYARNNPLRLSDPDGQNEVPFDTTPLGQDIRLQETLSGQVETTATPNSPRGGDYGFTRSGGTQFHGGIDDPSRSPNMSVVSSEAEISTYGGRYPGIVTRSGDAFTVDGTYLGKRVEIMVETPTGEVYYSKTMHHTQTSVKQGDVVFPGDEIGRGAGGGSQFSSPLSGDSHVHWEVRRDTGGAQQTLNPVAPVAPAPQPPVPISSQPSLPSP